MKDSSQQPANRNGLKTPDALCARSESDLRIVQAGFCRLSEPFLDLHCELSFPEQRGT
jgi:hypothetical protein